MKKRFSFSPFRMEMLNDGIRPYGLVLKRDLTVREAFHVLKNILCFGLDGYRDWFDSGDEIADFRNEVTNSTNQFLRGDCDYAYLCDVAHCPDDDSDGFPWPYAITLLKYLQTKNLI